MTRELVGGSLTEERVAQFGKQQAAYAAREALQQLPSVQEAMNIWLRQVRKGRFELKIDTSDPRAERMDELRGMVRTITLGLLVVGLVLASAIVTSAPHTGTFQWVRDVGAVVYVVALLLALVFTVDLIRRSARRRREARARRFGGGRAAGRA